MTKKLLKERFQQLAGIRPLYSLNEGDISSFIDRETEEKGIVRLSFNTFKSIPKEDIKQYIRDNYGYVEDDGPFRMKYISGKEVEIYINDANQSKNPMDFTHTDPRNRD